MLVRSDSWRGNNGLPRWQCRLERGVPSAGRAGAGYPGSFHDVATAADLLKALATLDLGNVVVVGHSASGQFALWAAARSRLPPDSPLLRKEPLHVKGAVSLAGIGDLKMYRDRGPGLCSEASAID